MSRLALTQTFQYGFSPLTTACIQASNGDYLLAGKMYDADGRASGFIIRVKDNGVLLWERTYSSGFAQYFEAITRLPDDTLVATGSKFWSGTAGDEYIWVVRLDANGNILSENTYGNRSQQSDGLDVATTKDGGFVVLGAVLDKAPNARPTTSILKFGPDAEVRWHRLFDGARATAIIQTRDGGYALCGARPSPRTFYSYVYVLRLDASGNKAWDRAYEDASVYVLLDGGIVENPDGHFALVAKSVIMEIDPSGNPVWKRQENDLSLNTIVRLGDGSYAVGGGFVTADYEHAYVATLDRKGVNITWDNAEITYPSGTAQLFVNDKGFVTGGGFVPFNGRQRQVFLSAFYPARPLAAKKRKAEVTA